ncbi:hypothetical protein TRVL_02191 [Trypanosoma vivax]|nr:hypothetical protein TRVL_02191 [Trypanosoma vivax]
MRAGLSSASVRRRRITSPDAMQAQPTPNGDYVVSTFANVDLRVTKAAMEEYARRCETLSRENEQLRCELEKQEVESIKVVQHLNKKLEETQAIVVEQRGNIERLLSDSKAAAEALNTHYMKMLDERNDQLLQYSNLAQRLQTELRSSAHAIHFREEHRMELQRLMNQIDEMRMKHESELSALRFQTVDRKMRLLALEETMKESHKAQVERESDRLLEEKSQQLLKDHKELQEERVRLVKDIDELVQLTTVKNAECADVRRKGHLHQHACEEALRRIANNSRQARDLQMKTQKLEQQVKELLNEKQSIREELSRFYESKIQKLEKTLAETQSSLQSHRAELQKMRYIASKVVEQRSDLENFFYVALSDIRKMRSLTSKRGNTMPCVTRSAVSSALPSLSVRSHSKTYSSNFTSHYPQPKQRKSSQATKSQKLESDTGAQDTEAITASVFLTETQPHVTAAIPPGVSVGSTAHSVPPSGISTSSASGDKHSSRHHPNALSKSCLDYAIQSASGTHNFHGVSVGEDCGGAYLSDLSWEDKEKVIKALLYYINRACYAPLTNESVNNDEKIPVEAPV